MRTTNDVTRNYPTYDEQVVADDSAPRSLGDELLSMVFDGRRRAQVRARLMRRLDEQIVALTRATDSDIERVEQDARRLIAFTDLLLTLNTLSSMRDPSQLYKVKEKFADLKAVLATRTPNGH